MKPSLSTRSRSTFFRCTWPPPRTPWRCSRPCSGPRWPRIPTTRRRRPWPVVAGAHWLEDPWKMNGRSRWSWWWSFGKSSICCSMENHHQWIIINLFSMENHHQRSIINLFSMDFLNMKIQWRSIDGMIQWMEDPGLTECVFLLIFLNKWSRSFWSCFCWSFMKFDDPLMCRIMFSIYTL